MLSWALAIEADADELADTLDRLSAFAQNRGESVPHVNHLRPDLDRRLDAGGQCPVGERRPCVMVAEIELRPGEKHRAADYRILVGIRFHRSAGECEVNPGRNTYNCGRK